MSISISTITVLPPAPAISPPSPVLLRDNSGGLKLWSVALIATSALVSLIFLSCYYFYRRSVYGKKPEKNEEQEENRGTQSHWSESTDDDQERSMELEFLDKKKPIFDLDDLLCAAAEEIGRGKLGPTYKAMLECGSVVAVKRLEETNTSKKEFAQQVRLLGNIKHESLAKVISFHHSKEERMIVYEYVPDPTLFTLLHGENISTRLNWKTRVSIIEEIAKAMDFLHNQRVPHGNLKSSNVLIRRVGVNIRVKLTDYGFLRIVPGHKLSVGKTPEFGDSKKKLTRKADVYCFGILVLELVTGKVPLSPKLSVSSPLDNSDLSGWVKEAVNNEWSMDILDAEILGENEGYDDMLRLMEIALECTDELPERRPNMSRVLRNLRDMHTTLS
ncbi:hypothetical protein CASFOL_028045 [Castilleja foliolosa]|uniref:Protein kinase domain-containing protein n=1 Tax=Castilleja foliolosa TaxID=1961234 RepID=A0ABD3CIC8_9LAMI